MSLYDLPPFDVQIRSIHKRMNLKNQNMCATCHFDPIHSLKRKSAT